MLFTFYYYLDFQRSCINDFSLNPYWKYMVIGFKYWRKVFWLFRQERAFQLVLISWHAMDEIWIWILFWVVLAYIYLIKKKYSLLPCMATRYQHQPERPFLTKKSKNFPPKFKCANQMYFLRLSYFPTGVLLRRKNMYLSTYRKKRSTTVKSCGSRKT